MNHPLNSIRNILPHHVWNRVDAFLESAEIFTEMKNPRVLRSMAPSAVRGLLFKSGYLGGIGLWVFLLSFAGTFLYFILQGVVDSANLDKVARTEFFATIAFWVGILSLAVQLLATGRIISAIGLCLRVTTGISHTRRKRLRMSFLPRVLQFGFWSSVRPTICARNGRRPPEKSACSSIRR